MTAGESARSEERPKVSVCIVTYNQRDYIAECLESVVTQQTDFPFEVIVGDDASTDGTADIVRDYAARYPHLIRPLLHETNLGPFENYRVVHRAARGEYVAHLDGDDYWLPGKLTTQVSFLDSNLEYTAVFANAFVIKDKNKSTSTFNSYGFGDINKETLLSKGSFLNHSSFCYRSELKSILYNINGQFIDYYLYLSYVQNRKFYLFKECQVVYRTLSSNSIRRKFPKIITNCYWKAIEKFGADNKRCAAYGAAKFLSSVIISSMRSGDLFQLIYWNAKLIKFFNVRIVICYIFCIRILINKTFGFLKY